MFDGLSVYKKSSLKLNNQITLENDYGKKEYKIVGVINDSRYVSNLERGTNSLGDGNNSGFILVLNQGNEHMAVPDELFDLHDQKTFYNDLRIHLKMKIIYMNLMMIMMSM